jgi:hypothetical protein
MTEGSRPNCVVPELEAVLGKTHRTEFEGGRLETWVMVGLDVHFVNPVPVHFGVDNGEKWGIVVSCLALSPLSAGVRQCPSLLLPT